MLYLFQAEELTGWEKAAADSVPAVFWLVVAVGVMTIVLSLINMLKTPKSLVGLLIGLAVLAGLFLLAWGVSSDAVPENLGATGGMYKLIGGALGTAFILMGIGVVILLIDLVRGLFKF